MSYNDMVKAAGQIQIGLSGKARSGKDMAARYLASRYGFVSYAFADRLKSLAMELFGMRPNEKDRLLLTELGRKMCSIDPLVWVNRVLVDAIRGNRVVISDVRLPDEWHVLKAFGFTMVRVEASAEVRKARATLSSDSVIEDDPSETALDSGYGWDLVIHGDTTIADMYLELDRMMFEKFGVRDLRK